MQVKRIPLGAALLGMICLLFLLFADTLPVAAASAPTVRTTLTDGITQRGSKRTFDVWARNAQGNKINAKVVFNGTTLQPTWNDSDKASYTLSFTQEGVNTVTVSASSQGKTTTLTYRITYRRANPGDVIGQAVWSVELFTIGGGYLVPPVGVDILEGENAAQALVRLLHDNGYVAYYGGSLDKSFYLGYIDDGTSTRERFENYQRSGTPGSPRALNLSPAIPALLDPFLRQTMSVYEPGDYANWRGYLGEFVFTNGSGWMYSVNNIFPNVGFADSYPSDGDVIRVQYTLGYGADIGGFGAIGTVIPGTDGKQPTGGYFAVANKDALTASLARARTSGLLARENMKRAYEEALSAVMTLDASQSRVDAAAQTLAAAFANPGMDTGTQPTDPPQPTTAQPSQSGTASTAGRGEDSSTRGTTPATTGHADSTTSSDAAESGDATLAPTDGNPTAVGDPSDAPAGTSATSRDTPAGPAGTARTASGAWIWWTAGGVLLLGSGGAALWFLYVKKRLTKD